MTLKSTIDIDIDDAKFQRFKEQWDKYSEALKKMPEIWKKIGVAHQAQADTFSEIAATMGKIANMRSSALADAEFEEEHLATSARLWTSIAHSTKGMAGNIKDATLSLLKWTGIIGFIGSAIGVGGFLGVGHLATDIAGQRRSAKGRGMTPGEQAAFGIDLGRFVDPDSFMSRVAEMEIDRTQQAPAWQLLGHRLTGQTGPDAVALLRAAYARVQGIANQDLIGPITSPWAAGLFGPEELLRLRNTKPSEFEAQLKANAKDATALNIQEKIAKDYQEAATAIERFGALTQKTTADALDPFARKIPALTDEFSKLISAFAKWPVIKEAIDTLADLAGNLAHPGKALAKLNAIPETNAYDTVVKWIKGSWLAPDKKWAAGHYDEYLSRLDAHSGLAPGFLERWRALEASGNNSVSKKGAVGQFQFMPETWKQYGRGGDPRDPVDAANAAMRMGADLAREFAGDLAKALASINAGSGRVEASIAKYGPAWLAHLPTETQAYVGRGMTLTIQNNTGGSATVAGSQVAGQ